MEPDKVLCAYCHRNASLMRNDKTIVICSYMKFKAYADLPEHSHAAHVGFVLYYPLSWSPFYPQQKRKAHRFLCKPLFLLVELRGLEPLTS